MTQYMMSVHDDGSDPYAPDELQAVYDTVDRFNKQLQADGYWVFGRPSADRRIHDHRRHRRRGDHD